MHQYDKNKNLFHITLLLEQSIEGCGGSLLFFLGHCAFSYPCKSHIPESSQEKCISNAIMTCLLLVENAQKDGCMSSRTVLYVRHWKHKPP